MVHWSPPLLRCIAELVGRVDVRRAHGGGERPLPQVLRAVPAQVEIRSKHCKQSITFHFRALKPGAFNRVARGNTHGR